MCEFGYCVGVCWSYAAHSVAVSASCFHAGLCIIGRRDVCRGVVEDLGPNPLQHQAVDLEA